MSDRLKRAVYLPNFGSFGQVRVLAEVATEAEAAGWDGFFSLASNPERRSRAALRVTCRLRRRAG